MREVFQKMLVNAFVREQIPYEGFCVYGGKNFLVFSVEEQKILKPFACLVLILILWGFPVLSVNADTLPEREALIALYISTDGINWGNKDGWKTPPLHTDGFADPCTDERIEVIQLFSEDELTACP